MQEPSKFDFAVHAAPLRRSFPQHTGNRLPHHSSAVVASQVDNGNRFGVLDSMLQLGAIHCVTYVSCPSQLAGAGVCSLQLK